ncbi:MAG: hypothetical protein H6606_08840 [Flavobacteriales bacterium]|nr:hypothetical protein [Flavobacteriales bacterium]
MSRNSLRIVVIFLALASTSCRKNADLIRDLEDVKGVEWSPEFAAPLINASLGLSDLIEQTNSELIEVDGDKLIHIIYRGDLISIEANQVLHIEDQSFDNPIIFNQSELTQFNLADSVILNRTIWLDYDVEFGEIDSVFLRYVLIEQEISKNFDHEVQVQFRFPTVLKQKLPLQFRVPLIQGSTSAQNRLDLFNSSMDMSTGNFSVNQVPVELSLKVKRTGSSVLDGNSEIAVKQMLKNHDYDLLYGYTGTDELINDEADTLVLNIFDRSSRGSFTVDDPRIKLYVTNSYGIPAETDIVQLRSYSTNSGFQNITGFPSKLLVEAPGIDEVGSEYSDSIILNKNTSNIADIINSKPEKIVFQFASSSNPQGKIRRNFALRNSKLAFRLDLDFPLKGTADNYGLEQTSSFSFDPGEGTELDEVVLRLAMENEFPLDLDLQLYFLDENGVTLDSLFSTRELLLASPPVDAAGRSQGSTKSFRDIRYSSDRIEHLKRSKEMKIVAGFNTTRSGSNQPVVAFYSDYRLNLKLGVAAAIRAIGQ